MVVAGKALDSKPGVMNSDTVAGYKLGLGFGLEKKERGGGSGGSELKGQYFNKSLLKWVRLK